MKQHFVSEPMRAIHKARMALAWCSGKRLPELEHIVLTSPRCAYIYALEIISGRWIEAEDIIMTDALWSYHYAIYVIKGKLPENMHNMMLLHAIKNSNNYAIKYFEFIKDLDETRLWID